MPTPNHRPLKASLHTLGCRLNQSETNIIRERLETRGYRIVPFGETADLGIINTCTVTREADAKSRKSIRAFIRANPHAFVAVIGCYSQMGAQAIAEIDGVDLIIGSQEKLNVLDYVSQGKNTHPLIVRDRILRDDFTIAVGDLSTNSRRANLKIQDGCDFMCSFCVIPFARGRARSRELNNLLDEARLLVRGGVREVVLTGVNIGAYRSTVYGITEVVDRLNEIEDLRRIRISSIEPTTIPSALFSRMTDRAHALVPYLHIPLQSGSDAVLKSMGRRYTRDDFTRFIDYAHGAVPGLCIGTDVMVGFPGEREDDFDQTCELLLNGPLAYAHVFKYSERDGTAAIRMRDPVPPELRNQRSARIREISARNMNLFHEKHVGSVETVLFEHEDDGYWLGYTGNYIRVAVRSNDILENEIREVRLETTNADLMFGQCVGEYSTEAIA